MMVHPNGHRVGFDDDDRLDVFISPVKDEIKNHKKLIERRLKNAASKQLFDGTFKEYIQSFLPFPIKVPPQSGMNIISMFRYVAEEAPRLEEKERESLISIASKLENELLEEIF